MSGAGTNGFTVLEPTPAAPPRVSLLSSARVVDDNSREWQNGFAVAPELCLPQDGPFWWECADVGGTDARASALLSPVGEKGIAANEDVVEYRPWLAQVGDQCSTFGWQARDFQGRARRALVASESRIVETELMTGAIATEAVFPNLFLQGPQTVDLSPGGSSPLVYALAALQQAISEGQNGRGMIHATIPTVTLWLAADAVRRDGNLILDGMDNIIVPGAGYDGGGPGGTAPDPTGETAWAYASGIIEVRRSDVSILPGSLEEALDRAANLIEWRAERTVAAWWDGCVSSAINVNLCSTCCEPA
jgi:hypothetical protein